MEQDTKIKILVVEDDISLKDSLVRLLQNRDFLVQAVENKQQAVEQIKSGQQYDIYLLDVWLPDGNGFDICHEIRKISQAIVMFLTSCDDEESITKGLDIGGDDYITKPFNPLELVARVKSHMRRYTQLGNLSQQSTDTIYRCGGLQINDDTKEVYVDDEQIKLTPIEYNILLLLVKNAGKVFSIDEIYEQIWNEEAIGADNTVAVHIRHIREKIEINPREPRYLKVVWGVGYKIEKQ